VTLRIFIKFFVSAGGVHSWQGRFCVCLSKFGRVRSRRQAVAGAPDQRRSHNTTTPKNTKQERVCVVQKSGRVLAGRVVPVGRVTSNFGREPPFVHTKILETTLTTKRAHLRVASHHGITDKPRRICCLKGFFGQGVR
jgi:hypothetical protein